jgi:cell fate regulator YaaT (PSP1 superfamily)
VARVVSIQFSYAGKLYDFTCGTMELHPGDQIVVETEKGRGIGSVVREPRELPDGELPEGIKQVLRAATEEDLQSAARNKVREKDARAYCLKKISERNLDMKLIRVEYLFDGSKAIFFFTADGRIDFRDLVKDLAYAFHTRIEMRQVGVRDEAKMVGGIGICGRELCCSSFLREFEPVSVKMAKEQNLALNPTKISGQCGRLLCCLGYEYETYSTLKKSLPKCGRYIQCGEVCGEVVKQNVITGTVTVRTEEHREVVVRSSDILPEHIMEKPKKLPPKEVAEAAPPHRQSRDNRPPQKSSQRRTDRKGGGRGPKEKS